jgi:hypothetical protein
MKVINSDTSYMIQNSDNIAVFDDLPKGTYSVSFSPQRGFWLEVQDNFKVTQKLYGKTNDRIEHVLSMFNHKDKSTGVILSGTKGMGKTMFAKRLSQRALDQSLPTIMVNNYDDGIAEFLSSIKTPAVIIFDEFEKSFKNHMDSMLTLFDGLNTSKKLFVITANNLTNLSEYLINRPGRFHYLFEFDQVSSQVASEFIQDHVENANEDTLKGIQSLSSRIPITYDYLDAISDELNVGTSLKDALNMLNISTDGGGKYTVKVFLTNGEEFPMPSVIENWDSDYDINFEDGNFVLETPRKNVNWPDYDIKGDVVVNVKVPRSMFTYNVNSGFSELSLEDSSIKNKLESLDDIILKLYHYVENDGWKVAEKLSIAKIAFKSVPRSFNKVF